MKSRGEKYILPKYQILDIKSITEIHRISIEILSTIGIKISHPEAVEMLNDNGCSISKNNLVKIPEELVLDSLQSAPSRINIFSQDGEIALDLGNRRSYYGTGTDLIRTIDIETNQIRLSTLQDVSNAAIVSDYCRNIDFIASYALPSDVPVNTMYLRCVKSMLEHSSKPIFFTSAGIEDLSLIYDMALCVAGSKKDFSDKPFLIHYSEPTAPLTHSIGAIGKLFFCADNKIPICYTAGDIIGGTTPVTLAGSIAQANAESLSGIVLHQLRNPGAPIISGFASVAMDMRTTIFSYGAPDFRLTNSAMADLYHYYDVPMWSTVGTDAQIIDEQAAMEHAMGTLLSSLDGANLIHDVGYLGSGLLGSPAAIVMCDEIVDYVKRILKGIRIDKESFAINIIREVGQGGNFTAEKHTVKNFKNELWQPTLLNRKNLEKWKQNGSRKFSELAIEKTKNILKEYKPKKLPIDIQNKIDKIAESAEVFLADIEFHA